MAARRSLEERFWPRVDFGGVCWEWTGPTSRGYGKFSVTSALNVSAHRFAWTSLVGPIEDGLQIDHLCRNRVCVNPDHLEPVTAAENVRRSGGAAALNARKTHCLRGHPFDDENTKWVDDGTRRVCRTCQYRAQRAWNAAHRELINEQVRARRRRQKLEATP